MLCPALFLDRDGIINLDTGYVHRKEDFVFIDGIFSLVKTACNLNYKTIVVTNQAGIGRGYYTEEQFNTLMSWVQANFRQKEAALDAVYYCPDHPDYGIGKYKCDSFMRKPKPGMLLKAAQEHGIDLPASFMVGDSYKDIEAGKAAGVGFLFYMGSKHCPQGARKVSHLGEIEFFLLNHQH